MNTPSSVSDRPPKRLRLGTRSCAECRRRKVRCVFGPDKKICDGCLLHEVECVPQREKKTTSESSGSKQDDQGVHQKLANLEEMVRRIAYNIDMSSDSSERSVENNTAEVLRRIQAASSQSENGSISGTELSATSERGLSAASQQSADQHADAPLLALFRDAMLIQDIDVHQITARAPRDRRLASCVKTFRTVLPKPNDLNEILKATQTFWPIWKHGQGLTIDLDPKNFETVRAAATFIYDSMTSVDPARVTKAVLFVALCIQQLPHEVADGQTNFSANPELRLDPYLLLADMLLSINENSTPTIEGLECLEIMAKLYMNMGKPRECWLCGRRGINLGLMLRLHTSSGTAGERGHKVWSHLWQIDRHISLKLGLPSATSDLHPGISKPHPDAPIIGHIFHDMAVIAGHISERDQNSATADYYTTLQIDQEIRTCLQQIPLEWWNSQPLESTPIEAVYALQVLKIQFYYLQKDLHQPYMLKSFSNSEYEPSNSAACDASREMIHAYQTLRNHNGTELIICDLMDFQVFTAAVVLIIKHLGGPTPCPYRYEGDWELIDSVTTSLKKVAQAIECTVASQASQILEYLTAAHRGTYSGPSQFESIIPYFGRVKINMLQPQNSVPQIESTDFQMDNSMPFPASIDLEANAFVPFSWNDGQDFLSGAELGIDWTSVINEGMNYDWSQHFDPSQIGGAYNGDGSTFLTA